MCLLTFFNESLFSLSFLCFGTARGFNIVSLLILKKELYCDFLCMLYLESHHGLNVSQYSDTGVLRLQYTMHYNRPDMQPLD